MESGRNQIVSPSSANCGCSKISLPIGLGVLPWRSSMVKLFQLQTVLTGVAPRQGSREYRRSPQALSLGSKAILKCRLTAAMPPPDSSWAGQRSCAWGGLWTDVGCLFQKLSESEFLLQESLARRPIPGTCFRHLHSDSHFSLLFKQLGSP